MKKVYYLKSCNTCIRIIKQLGIGDEFEYQNIKEEKITAKQLDQMKQLSGSYEALFSRRAMKYRQLGLNERQLTEKEYRQYILEEYTFLKRPVFIIKDTIFIGNTKKVIEAIEATLKSIQS